MCLICCALNKMLLDADGLDEGWQNCVVLILHFIKDNNTRQNTLYAITKPNQDLGLNLQDIKLVNNLMRMLRTLLSMLEMVIEFF